MSLPVEGCQSVGDCSRMDEAVHVSPTKLILGHRDLRATQSTIELTRIVYQKASRLIAWACSIVCSTEVALRRTSYWQK